ncbi:MAG: hypothetical protein IKV79_05065 [Oscillospiraceae bacterium]|nr:hypothetical protein [Oscillospiraceae bacterium]
MKKILSVFLAIVMIMSLCSGIIVNAAGDDAVIAVAQGNYTQSADAQDITIRISTPGVGEAYCTFGIYETVLPEGFVVKSITNNNTNQPIVEDDVNLDYGALTYFSTSDNIPADTYYDVVISAPANAIGDVEVTFVGIEVAKDGGDTMLAEIDELTTTVTINAAPTAAYTAELAGPAAALTVGDEFTVDVVVGGTTGNFASSKVVLTYDSSILGFDKADAKNVLNGAEIDVTNGTITIIDHGVTQQNGTAYTLNFKANTASEGTNVALTAAAFSTAENADDQDLTPADPQTDTLTVVINKAQHSVELPAIYTGADSVEDGASYTFKPETATGAYYNYGTPTATMDGQPVAVTGDATNGWTIVGVTGDIVISGTRTEKTYNFDITGEGSELVTASGIPTYNTAFSFTLPEGQDVEGINDGYHYEIVSVTVGGNEAGSYDANSRTYTIVGTDVTGDIAVTVKKVVDKASTVTVTVNGSDVKVDGASSVTVVKGSEVTLTMTPETGYDYTVKVGDTDVTADIADGEYKFNADASVTVTATKTLDIESAKVYEYVQLNAEKAENGSKMWLVTINGNGTEQIAGKTYTYGGQNMLWSDKYQAYAILVCADAEPSVTGGFALITVDAIPTVNYDMDVNGSGIKDANDAQLIYNMYTAVYGGFTTKVPMEKFLAADQNADINNIGETYGLQVADSRVIISYLISNLNG